MKRLYTLLVILIVIYIGINVAVNGFTIFPVEHNDNVSDVASNDSIIVGASSFPAIENFSDSAVNDTTVSLSDGNGVTIYVSEIDNSQNISDTFNNFLNNNPYTSTQTIDQNGVTTYLAYDEGSQAYNADIFFNKNGQNYCITGDEIYYINSDYFINHCKGIIDSIEITSTS